MLIKANTGHALDSLWERVSGVEMYFKLVLIFREFLAVVKPMQKQALSVRVTRSSVSLKNLRSGLAMNGLNGPTEQPAQAPALKGTAASFCLPRVFFLLVF